MSTKIELLRKLQLIHKHYKNASNETQIRIFNASEFVVKKLEKLQLDLPLGVGRVGRAWVETYLCYGDEFLKFEFNTTMDDLLSAIDNQ